MFYFIVTLLLFYSKPIYWLGRIAHLYFSNQSEDPRIVTYQTKLKDWFKQTWDWVKWQKQDM